MIFEGVEPVELDDGTSVGRSVTVEAELGWQDEGGEWRKFDETQGREIARLIRQRPTRLIVGRRVYEIIMRKVPKYERDARRRRRARKRHASRRGQ